jgi:phosphoglycerate kinase
MSNVGSIENVDVAGKTVLVRADLNVPMDGGRVTDTVRIDRFAPTAQFLADKGARVVIVTHFGRPKGVRMPALSVEPIAKVLATRLGRDVKFVEECIGEVAEKAVWAMRDGDIVMLENVRFHAEETEDSEIFAQHLAVFSDIYVNDAFSCSHRAHTSTHAITKLLPSYAGLSLKKELDALGAVLGNPKRPIAALVGGAKVSTKITVLEALIPKMDAIIVGGGMANTFLLAKGAPIGASLAEPDFVDMANQIMDVAAKNDCEIVLPVDLVVANQFAAGAANEVVPVGQDPGEGMILDVGPDSIADLTARLGNLKTLLWNGPLGAFEIDPFGDGTFGVAKAAGELTKQGKLITVAGGGDTVAALNQAGVSDDFTYISTAGGAFLEWLEGKELPGVAALTQNN